MAESIHCDSSNGPDSMVRSQFMQPPSDWAFNNLVADIRQNLDANDIEKIKLRFKGIIPEAVRSWEEAFHLLQVERYISADNLIYLQIILRALDRSDLFEKTVVYAESNKQRILHFYPMPATHPKGHNFVRIHVEGGRCLTGADLQTIRNTISGAFLIPMDDIMVAGIEESNSVYLTFMLPDFFIETLRKILENPRLRYILKPLGLLGINEIKLPCSTFNVETEDETLHTVEATQSENIINGLKRQLQQKTYQLKELEKEILRIKRNKNKISKGRKSIRLAMLRLSKNVRYQRE
ncbi:uncharacterized protein LOC128554975 [Mercenaria mercenaria]|uniref:uncharacterized protein LOC128554975 n=1 Tax=Mercenaria mercenaria TaxID=6596 RepID=UPI00234E59B7|nr:uncharacterized protein LOC128554975 [Mercenaria mercenaria]XP_053392289.1 uncharacterized protein LOC128554975 [Mercenaria mercenaria]XP_053392290.1 uncharacterized protein LOC128554975 [Mercenaria mercenaria]XP_053392291.1 uncharacterized protein LOC128554975 [Mercenaria mercenaria]